MTKRTAETTSHKTSTRWIASLSLFALLALPIATTPASAGFRDWSGSEIDQIKSRVKKAKDNSEQIANRVQKGFESLTGKVRQMIDEAVDDLKTRVAEELEGRDDFLGEPECGYGTECGIFRDEMVSLIDNMEQTVNTMFDAAGSDITVDFSRVSDKVDKVPGRALYPLYKALAVDVSLPIGAFADRLGEMAANIQALRDTMHGIQVGDENACTVVLDNAIWFQSAVYNLTMTSAYTKLLAKELKASSETKVDGGAGIHGYVDVKIQANPRKSWGEKLEGVSDYTAYYATYASQTLSFCTAVAGTNAAVEVMNMLEGTDGQEDEIDRIRATQQALLANQQAIMATLAELQANGN